MNLTRTPLRLISVLACVLGLPACSAFRTANDMVVTHIPVRHEGRTSVLIDLSEQRATLFKGGHEVASSRISTGREGYRTPTGDFRVIRKDEDHVSGLYGDYVNRDGDVVKAHVDRRKNPCPRGAHFKGAPMPYFIEFLPGYGLHAGYLPGVPASHGCVRMPYWRARQFYKFSRVGTLVKIRR